MREQTDFIFLFQVPFGRINLNSPSIWMTEFPIDNPVCHENGFSSPSHGHSFKFPSRNLRLFSKPRVAMICGLSLGIPEQWESPQNPDSRREHCQSDQDCLRHDRW